MKIIYVKDYVTLPCSDAAPGIRQAIEEAKNTKADKIVFEKGCYPLKSWLPFETDVTAHDAGATLEPYKDVQILLNGLEQIVLEGAVHPDGTPATELAGFNDCKLHSLLPAILWVDGCKNITLSNLKLYRAPHFASAGKVIEKTPEYIKVEVLEGNPCYDGMGTHCMNRFLPDSRTLHGESVSYGPGTGKTFRLEQGRVLRLDDPATAAKVNEGEILSWHQGAKTDFQFFLGNSENVCLENIHTTNANGFAMLSFHIHNLKAVNVQVRPEDNQYFAAPRDAWKLHKCSGRIEMDRLHIEGVRMDGQNMHSNYLFVKKVFAPRSVQFFTRYSYIPLKNGTKMEFYHGTNFHTAEIESWHYDGETHDEKEIGRLFTVTFTSDIPYYVKEGTLCLAQSWEPDRYLCKDSTFLNIAGAGHLSRIDNMTIIGCTYKNLMNPGILLGAEFPTHQEGGHSRNITIQDCVFDHCGFFPRYGASGGVGIKSAGLPGKHNKNIQITCCQFKNSEIGVDIHDADGVTISDCVFEAVAQPYRIDPSTSGKIFID